MTRIAPVSSTFLGLQIRSVHVRLLLRSSVRYHCILGSIKSKHRPVNLRSSTYTSTFFILQFLDPMGLSYYGRSISESLLPTQPAKASFVNSARFRQSIITVVSGPGVRHLMTLSIRRLGRRKLYLYLYCAREFSVTAISSTTALQISLSDVQDPRFHFLCKFGWPETRDAHWFYVHPPLR